jgi:hypothetical protein
MRVGHHEVCDIRGSPDIDADVIGILLLLFFSARFLLLLSSLCIKSPTTSLFSNPGSRQRLYRIAGIGHQQCCRH